MSETAPERPAGTSSSSAAPASTSSAGPPKRENVFTRKIGPLPMWVWLVIVAAVVLLYVVWSSNKKSQQGSTSSGQQQQGGFGRALLPEVILEQLPGPPHQHHRHHRGGHKHHHSHHHRHHRGGGIDPGGPMDPGNEAEAVALAADRQKAMRDPGPGYHSVPGVNRRHMRGKGEPVPGELVSFKTAEQGQTPSLADVANQYDTEPEAIVMEAEGRGYPNSTAWKRYVAQHNWGDPLPPATQLSILAHPM